MKYQRFFSEKFKKKKKKINILSAAVLFLGLRSSSVRMFREII